MRLCFSIGGKGSALPARAASGIALTAVGALFAMIIAFAVPAFLQQGTAGIFIWSWRPYQGEFGILPMLAGSLLLSVSALVLAWPLALLVCCWTLTRSRGFLLATVRGCLRLMTAIPTVVYGFAAVFLVTPLVRGGLGGSGFCWLSAALVLALLILPTLVLVMEAGLAPRLEKLCPQGLAVGLDRMDLLWFFVLPQARKTMLAALLMGFGRAVGDTLVPLMLAGNAPQLPLALSDSLRTLTAHMALVTANEVGGSAYNSLFAAGALLLLINAATSLLLRFLHARQAGVEGNTG